MKLRAALLAFVISCALLCAMSAGFAQDDKKVESEKKALTADELARLLAEHRKQLNNVDALTLDEATALYKQAGENKEADGFKEIRDSWAKHLAGKAENGNADQLADSALLLDDDGYTELAKPLLRQAWKALKNAGKATREVIETRPNGTVKKSIVANQKFTDIVERLGWKPYRRPADMDACDLLEVEGAAEYRDAYLAVDQTWHDVGLYPPELVEQLTALEKPAQQALKLLREQDAKDGFAVKARQAWIRFTLAQNTRAKVDRRKGKRSFSPKAMGRENEAFEDVWTYRYSKPFVIYVEKPVGGEPEATHLKQLDENLKTLAELYAWFDEQFIQPMELKRQKPQHNAELADNEGWALEVVCFKDLITYRSYLEDATGVLAPIARNFYSPIEERLVTLYDPEGPETNRGWFDTSTMLREAFLLLADHYAANPQFSEDDLMSRPRFSSLMLRDGLADCVAGFERGEKGTAFNRLNHVRLAEFQNAHELLGKTCLFRLRDLPVIRHYGQCQRTAIERAQAEGIKVHPMWIQRVAVPIHNATACQAVYFLEHFKRDGEYVYREKWRAFLKDEFTGKHQLKAYDDDAAAKALQEALGVKDDAGWDAIEKAFLEFTLALKPEDVGEGAADLGKDQASDD
ncbi:MAG: hypothetical protein H6841_06870 [Planctomycetes bacterium]|nr:hypothetical protein [Planctomycetota bacterium]MCB9935306.1 hypothetical protein [Planctomycetota bacterium]